MSVLITESVEGLNHGHKTIGTTRAKLVADPLPYAPNKGVLLRCPGTGDGTANTTEVWVGGPSVTADNDPTSGGMPIAPGEAIFIPINDPTKLWVIAGAADQDVAWMSI